jgi:hypothetical protein
MQFDLLPLIYAPALAVEQQLKAEAAEEGCQHCG